MSCIFCNIPTSEYLVANDSFYAIKDKHPVSKGHILIISRRHYEDFFGISKEEMDDLRKIILSVKDMIDSLHKPVAYNIGMNCGKHAGQSIFHFHVHVIPRYSKDEGRKGLREYIKEIL